MRTVDLVPDHDLHRVARFAADLGERIRDEDPRRLFDELVLLCQYHPAKAAQLLMTHAAWFDPAQTTETLTSRAAAITASRVDALLLGKSA